MTATADILRGELERAFELDDLKTLSRDLLGLDPADLGAAGDGGKVAFARALVDRCAAEDSLEALGEAMVLTSRETAGAVDRAFGGGTGAGLAAGTAVGPFVLDRLLRPVPFGAVWSAQPGDGAGANGQNAPGPVAVRLVDPRTLPSRGLARRWLTVLRALTGARVPGMATVRGAGQLDDGTAWAAWDLVDGGSLAEQVGAQGPLPPEQAVALARTTLEALTVLHQRGAIHGDVSPEHVIVGPDGSAVLVDPGSDRLRPRSIAAGSGAASGDTLGFLVAAGGPLDPASLSGAAPSPATDVYGAGTVLYTALAGRPPFVGDNPLEVAVAHLTRTPQAPSRYAPGVPSALDDVVQKALAKDPSERFETAAGFLEALENAVAGTPSIPPAAGAELDEAAFKEAVDALKAAPGDDDQALAVERLAAPAGAHARAVEAFLDVADATDDAQAKRGLRLRAARLQHAELRDGEAAEGTYREILEADPGDAVALDGLGQAMRAAGKWDALAEHLLERVEQEGTAEGRAQVLRQLGELYERKIGDDENAFVAYVQALSETPRDPRLIAAVERLATTPERWQEALGTLSEAAQSTAQEDPATGVALYLRLGRWYADKAGRADFAVQCFGQAIALDPSAEEAFERTAALYRKNQAWAELAQVRVQQAEASTNPARARDLRAEAATVLHKRLGDADGAANLLRPVVDEDPAHPKATDALEAILIEQGEFETLADLLEARAAGEEGDARGETLVRIAELNEDRLDALDKAEVRYESVAAAHPTFLPALKGLERIYARKGKHQELLDNLKQQLVAAPTPRQKILLHERIGGLLEEEFVDREQAAASFEKIIALDPTHEAANAALARLYRQLNRFDQLADTYARHAAGVEETERRISLLLKGAEVLDKEVGAPERALELADRALAFREDHPQALEVVARLKQAVGDHGAAVQTLDKRIDAETDAVRKAALEVEAGNLLRERGDNDGAIDRYKRALDLAPGDTKASAALRELFAARGDAQGQIDLLDREIAVTEGELGKAKLLAEKGRLYHERLDDLDGALDAYGGALRLDPTSTAAAMGLGDIAYRAEDWPKVAEYYEPLLARTDDMAPAEAKKVAVRAGDGFREIGLPDKAERAYLQARTLDPDDGEVAERIADASFQAGNTDEAIALYGELFERFDDRLAGRARGLAKLHYGQALIASGQVDQAEAPLQEAADLLPDDLAPIEGLRVVYTEGERVDALLDVLQRGLDRAPNDDQRFELRVAAGDVLAAGLGKRDEAAEQYVKALEIRGNDRGLLGRLLEVYSDKNDWPRLLDTVTRIAGLIPEPVVQAKYWLTAGAISQHETGDREQAATFYRRALDGDPRLSDAFVGLVETMDGDADAKVALAEEQIQRLDAVDARPETKAKVWDALARVLEDAGRGADAVDALTRAQELEPTNRDRTQRLARALSMAPGDDPERAVEAHRSILAESPFRAESHRALIDVLSDAGRQDEAWAVAQSLHVLELAEPKDEKLFESRRREGPALEMTPLTAAAFRGTLQHPRENWVITGIFAAVTPAVLGTVGREVDGEPLSGDDNEMTRTLVAAAKVLGVELPPLVRRADDPGALGFLPTRPPAVALGQAAERGGPAKALAFVAARHLAYHRPGAIVRQLVPQVAGLRGWLLAAVKAVVPRFPIPGELEATVAQHLGAVQATLQGATQDRLRGLVERLLDDPELDVRRWVEGVDLTADRAGFALADDLGYATAVVKASPEDVAIVPNKTRVEQLHAYAVSGAYAELRKRI